MITVVFTLFVILSNCLKNYSALNLKVVDRYIAAILLINFAAVGVNYILKFETHITVCLCGRNSVSQTRNKMK